MFLLVVFWKSDLLFLDAILKLFGEFYFWMLFWNYLCDMFCIGKIEINIRNIHNEGEKNVKYSWFQIWLQTWIQDMSTEIC